MEKTLLKNWVVYICIILTILFEIIVSVLVYNKIGSERIGISIFRTFIQITFLWIIAKNNSKTLTYLLTFYHIIVGLTFFYKLSTDIIINLIFGVYHVIIGLVIYFNVELNNIFKRMN